MHGKHERHDDRLNPGLLALAALLACPPALAHHPMGGDTPATLVQGLLSGLGHPLIGWDHALFLVAVGLMSAAAARIWTLPVAFVVAVPLGVAGQELIGALPGIGLLPPLSVIGIAAIMVLRPDPPAVPMAALTALAGLAHGHAYAGAIVGAEPTPVVAYLVGLTVVQAAVAIGIALAVRGPLASAATGAARSLRFAGMALLALSAAFLTA